MQHFKEDTMEDNHKRQKSARTSAKATGSKTTKAHYLSINEQEFERLRQLGFRERWAYMEIKRLSNWKKGTCGEFDRQRITYAQIASLVTAPGVQGRGQGDIDDKQAADFLQRMEALGLVANIGRRPNGGLRFDMPLAPIQRAASAPSGEITPPTPGEIPVISPDQIASEMPALAQPALVCGELPASLSVMINKERNISIDGAESAAAEAAPCRASGAAPARENLPAQPQAVPRLSAQEIHQIIEADWDFFDTATPQSWALYESWAGAGITLDDLQAAMISLEEDASGPELTPSNLRTRLWPLVVDSWYDQTAA